MESPKESIRFQYTVLTKVLEIKWLDIPKGWFVHFDGSRESINFGSEPPTWTTGDIIKITFERLEPNATESNRQIQPPNNN